MLRAGLYVLSNCLSHYHLLPSCRQILPAGCFLVKISQQTCICCLKIMSNGHVRGNRFKNEDVVMMVICCPQCTRSWNKCFNIITTRSCQSRDESRMGDSQYPDTIQICTNIVESYRLYKLRLEFMLSGFRPGSITSELNFCFDRQLS